MILYSAGIKPLNCWGLFPIFKYNNYYYNSFKILFLIFVLVANVDVAKTLRKPQNLMELKTYVSYMKDKSGITGWTDRQELLPVSKNVVSCIME